MLLFFCPTQSLSAHGEQVLLHCNINSQVQPNTRAGLHGDMCVMSAEFHTSIVNNCHITEQYRVERSFIVLKLRIASLMASGLGGFRFGRDVRKRTPRVMMAG